MASKEDQCCPVCKLGQIENLLKWMRNDENSQKITLILKLNLELIFCFFYSQKI